MPPSGAHGPSAGSLHLPTASWGSSHGLRKAHDPSTRGQGVKHSPVSVLPGKMQAKPLGAAPEDPHNQEAACVTEEPGLWDGVGLNSGFALIGMGTSGKLVLLTELVF